MTAKESSCGLEETGVLEELALTRMLTNQNGEDTRPK